MLIRKCDICKKNISGEPVLASMGYFRNKEFCNKCGKPVLDFLKKNKLIESGDRSDKEKTKRTRLTH